MEVRGSPDDAALKRLVTTPPLDFEAFCDLHRDRYLGYATVHLGSKQGAEVVREVFGYLATQWSYVLSRPNPAAYAWEVFTTLTRIHSAPEDGSRALCPVHRLLGPLSHAQHDAVVLHYLLGHSVEDAALTMGLEGDRGRIPSLLRQALRH